MPIHGYPGGVITANPVAPTSTVATGVWTTEQQLQAVSQGNWPFTIPTQQISRSLRFNSADSAYLNRTPASAGNRKTWTWSAWVKRSALGATQGLFGAYSAANNTDNLWLGFSGGDLFIISRNSDELRRTTQVFRDVSAWYHIVVTLDTTQATANDRVKVYLNGTQITAFTTTNNPTQNDNQGINQAAEHRIGRRPDSTDYLNSYLTEINFVDGQALTPSSFGQTNTSTGVWEPINYTGTYGTNGFELLFADNSGTTSTTLGADTSGNGNNWTPNNFSVTAGAGNDSLVDSPTAYGTDTGVGGEVRGNYCTLNPLSISGTPTIRNGNLDIAYTGADGAYGVIGTVGVSSGKWYFETTLGSDSTFYVQAGFLPTDSQQKTDIAQTLNSNYATGGYADVFDLRRGTGSGSTLIGSSSTTPAAGGVFGVSFDIDVGEMRFYYNGTQLNVAITSGIATGKTWVPFVGLFVNDGMSVNFGQRAFAYTAPSGFKALCTQNLPTPTIGATSTTQANDYFDTTLYTGTGSDLAIVNSGGMAPDFVWVKVRNQAFSHNLNDIIRGANSRLQSDTNAAAGTTGIVSFNSNGFTTRGASGELGANGNTYVAWQWKGGGTGVTNTAGTISSTVSANTTSGFSVVTYTGSSTGNDGTPGTVGHGLGIAPGFILFKPLDTYDGCAYSSGLTSASYRLVLFSVSGNLAEASDNGFFNGTAPTSTVFSVGTRKHSNSNGGMVAYCFAPVAGYSAFGSYTGNGSSDGPFVYTGFRPRYVLIKRTDTTNNWFVSDSSIAPYNLVENGLYPNLSNAEGAINALDFLSNGFKPRANYAGANASGGTYIYMAFAENPFKYSLAR